MCLLALLLSIALAAPSASWRGWRHDGTGHAPDSHPAVSGTEADATWIRPLPSWSNASPVPLGDQVCVLSEPVDVLCFAQATGAPTWRADNDRIHTVPAAERPAALDARRRLAAAEDRIRGLLAEVSAARRALRAGTGTADALEGLSRALDAARTEADALADWGVPELDRAIGTTSHSPLAQDGALYVLTGNGVVSRFDADGTRRWSRWLGPPVRPMQVYHHGSASSPVWVDGKLIVAFGVLQALDPETGATIWAQDTPWRRFATPSVGVVAGVPVVLIDRAVLRASDGAPLVDVDLPEHFYVSPVLHGDVVYAVGSKGADGEPGNATGAAVRLARQGDRVVATPLWRRALDRPARHYATPVVHDGRLYALDLDNQLAVLDAATGATLHTVPLEPLLDRDRPPRPHAWSNLHEVGGRLLVGFQHGEVLQLELGDGAPRSAGRLSVHDDARGTPTVVGDALYVRTLTALLRFDP